jgi:hypothetical protein
MGFFKNRLNNSFLVAFNSSRFLMALIEVSCIRISSFPKVREGPPSGGRNTYKLFLFPLGHGRMKKGSSPSGGTGINEAIILLDFVLVNMEAVRERRKTTGAVWSSPPRYAWQVVGDNSQSSKSEKRTKFPKRASADYECNLSQMPVQKCGEVVGNL